MNFIRSVATRIRVARIPRGGITRSDWDRFAQECGASFRCSFDAPAWHLERQLPFRLRRLEIFCDDRKIGQCAVAIGRQSAAFLDGLQLRPEYADMWPSVMDAVLSDLGSGHYRYGSHWSIEPAREHALGVIDGVSIEIVKPVVVHAIDFSRWRCWDDYIKQVSSNARRNAARAQKDHLGLAIRERRGLSALLDTKTVTRLQLCSLQRKNVSNPLKMPSLRYLLRVAAMRTHAISAVSECHGRDLAAFSGIQFGSMTYYLTGGSEVDCGGASWYLMLGMIEQAYNRTNGGGKFLMGSVEEQSAGWSNLLRSREQCRVSEMPTSVVEFRYTG